MSDDEAVRLAYENLGLAIRVVKPKATAAQWAVITLAMNKLHAALGNPEYVSDDEWPEDRAGIWDSMG